MTLGRLGFAYLLTLILASGTALAIVDADYRRARHGELLMLVAGGLLGAWSPPGRDKFSQSAQKPSGKDAD